MASWAHRAWNLRCACDSGRASVICRLQTINGGRGRGHGQRLRLIAGSTAAWSRGLQTTASLNDTYPVKMPSLSPTMAEGTIVKWCKKEGEKFEAGDTLLEIQTDKAVMSMELEEEGILAKILVPEGSADVKVGTLIALTVDEGDDWQNVQVPAGADAAPAESASGDGGGEAKTEEKAKAPATSKSTGTGSGRLLGPAVKSYLQQYGIDAAKVPATGPHGNVLKDDVLKYVKDNKLAGGGKADKKAAKGKGQADKPTPASYQDIELTSMRKTIAKRLHESKSTIPHSYGTVLCEMNNLIDFRKRLTSVGLKVSVNDMIIKCSASALGQNPVVNTVWEKGAPVQKGNIDISVAVATPTGLITPIVPNASGKDVIAIGDTVKALAKKARDGKLQPHEFVGGTFCISNLGMFGVDQFYAIINPPQSAILAVGTTSNEMDEHGNPLSTSKLMLSYDARVIMDDEAAKFLADLKKQVEDINEVSMGLYDLDQKSDDVKTDEAMKEKEAKEEEAAKAAKAKAK